MEIIERPDGLRYAVAEQPQPGVPTFADAEIRVLYDNRPLPDELGRALILVKQVFPGARVEEARRLDGFPL